MSTFVVRSPERRWGAKAQLSRTATTYEQALKVAI
ncbi:hypothetical protein M2344_001664 [Sphingobium sp. B8D3C]|nr:hypothetical protein [Sphingobium sp. B8D3B]MCW2418702.1 hypothetical protein [Sphingobium sp. B8D3C]